jgi:hypothetical protein|uniref:Uncharacterized protein n=1 Tax=Zea mays TaxID=4577 RepID=C4JBM6_MAIZE|nr:unknown [Zea mays]
MGAASAPIFRSVRGPVSGPGSALQVAKWRCCCQAGRQRQRRILFHHARPNETESPAWTGLGTSQVGLWPWIVLSPSGRVSRRLWPWPPSNAMIKGVLAKSLKRWRGVFFSIHLNHCCRLQRADFFFMFQRGKKKTNASVFFRWREEMTSRGGAKELAARERGVADGRTCSRARGGGGRRGPPRRR